MVIRNFLENGFEATSNLNANVLNIWKEHLLLFCKFLCYKFEIIFWESEATRSKLSKSTFDHRYFLRKWFQSSLELNNQYCVGLKIAFLVFCKFLIDEVETIFWESETNRSKLFKWKFGHRKLLIKWFWSYLEIKTNVLSVLKEHFSVFCKFLIDEVEIVFWESETMLPKLFP